MQSSKNYYSQDIKPALLSPSNRKSNETIKTLLPEGDKQSNKILPQEQVSSNKANLPNKSIEKSDLPFINMGKVSFHIRDRISVIIAGVTYTTLEFIDQFTEGSDIGKEFIKYVK